MASRLSDGMLGGATVSAVVLLSHRLKAATTWVLVT